MIPDDMTDEVKSAGIVLQINNMQDILKNKQKTDSMMTKLKELKDQIKDEA